MDHAAAETIAPARRRRPTGTRAIAKAPDGRFFLVRRARPRRRRRPPADRVPDEHGLRDLVGADRGHDRARDRRRRPLGLLARGRGDRRRADALLHVRARDRARRTQAPAHIFSSTITPPDDGDGDGLPDASDCAPGDAAKPARNGPDADCDGVVDQAPRLPRTRRRRHPGRRATARRAMRRSPPETATTPTATGRSTRARSRRRMPTVTACRTSPTASPTTPASPRATAPTRTATERSTRRTVAAAYDRRAVPWQPTSSACAGPAPRSGRPDRLRRRAQCDRAARPDADRVFGGDGDDTVNGGEGEDT